jgi:cytochrome c-type biogenesis protein CcmH/NrfF
VWLLPFALLITGVIVAVNIVRQRSRLVAGDDSVIDTEERR